MLFSYKIFTFSQLPNKFYIRKSTSTHRKSTTIHTKPTTTQHKNHQNTTTHTITTTKKKIRDQREKDWEVEGKRDRLGKRDRSSAVAMIFSGGDEIGLGWWRRCMAYSRLSRSELNLSHQCMAGDRRGGSWVFVDWWWGRGMAQTAVPSISSLGDQPLSLWRWAALSHSLSLCDSDRHLSLSLSLGLMFLFYFFKNFLFIFNF